MVRCTRKELPACAKAKLASQDKRLYAKEGAFYLQNGTTSEMWPFCRQMFRQKGLLGQCNERKIEETLKSKNHTSQMYTQQTWVVWIVLISFDLIIPLEGSRKSGTDTSSGTFLKSLLAMATYLNVSTEEEIINEGDHKPLFG